VFKQFVSATWQTAVSVSGGLCSSLATAGGGGWWDTGGIGWSTLRKTMRKLLATHKGITNDVLVIKSAMNNMKGIGR